MIFSVQVDNKHLTRLGTALGYTGDPQDAAAFKTFVENTTIRLYRKLIKAQVLIEEKAKINVNILVPDSDVTSAP